MSDMNRNNDLKPERNKSDDFSLEEIMAEYKSNMVLNTIKPEKPVQKQDIPPEYALFSDVRGKLKEDKEALFNAHMSPAKDPETPEQSDPADEAEEDAGKLKKKLGIFKKSDDEPAETQPVPEQVKPEDFSKHFAPSDTFVGDVQNDIPDEQIEDGEPQEQKKTKKKKKQREKDVEKLNISPEDAYRSMARQVHMMGLRSFIAALFCIPQVYILLAPRFNIWLPEFLQYVSADNPASYRPYLFICVFLQLLVMFMSVEVSAAGLRDFARFRPGAESLVTLSCFVSCLHAISILIFPKWGGYLPYSAVTSVSMFFAMWGTYLKQAALKATYKTVAIAKSPYIVWKEDGVFDGLPGYVKGEGTHEEFVSLCESEDGAARIYSFVSPLLIVASIVLAALSSFGREEPQRFLWAFSAILTGAAPFSMLLSFSLPFRSASRRLSKYGAALTGYFGTRVFFKKGAVMVRDTDLFPPGAVFLNGLKVFGNHSIERVISYAASMIKASGCGLSNVFSELLSKQAGGLMPVENLCHYEGGGISAEINGDRVLAGTSDFLTRMGIRLPRGMNMRSAVLISINHELTGVFAINYSPTRSVKYAIHSLLRHKSIIVLAVLDFNITPNMIKQKFKLNTDIIEYPTVEERIIYAGYEKKSYTKLGAVLTREGLAPFAEAVTAARRVSLAYIGNMIFSLTCATAGILIMFYMTYIFSPIPIAPHNLMLFMALWTVPPLLISGWVNRY